MTTNETVIKQIAGNLQKIIDTALAQHEPKPIYWVSHMVDRIIPVPFLCMENVDANRNEDYVIFNLVTAGQTRGKPDEGDKCRTTADIYVDERSVDAYYTDDGWDWEHCPVVDAFTVQFGEHVFEVELTDLYEGVELSADEQVAV